MEIIITKEEMTIHHKEILNEIGKKSDSVMQYFYSYGMQIKSLSFDEMMGDVLNKNKQPKLKITLEQSLSNVVGLSISARIIGSQKRQKQYSLSEKPKLFIDKFSILFNKGQETQNKEKERINKLTPEERQRETQEILNELSSDSGFMGFNIGPAGMHRIQTRREITYDIDDVLDKISRVGIEGLTKPEKDFMDKQSKK